MAVEDERRMRLALAGWCRCMVSSNPLVNCVLVRDGSGVREGCAELRAEVDAVLVGSGTVLANAVERVSADVSLTSYLEPA